MASHSHHPTDIAASRARNADDDTNVTIPAAASSENTHVDLFAKIQRAKQEWEATVDSLSELVCLLDTQGCIIRANRVVETWGLGRVQHVKGLSLHQLLHPQCLTAVCALYGALQQAEQTASRGYAAEAEVYDETLSRHLRIRVGPVLDTMRAALSMAVVVIEDISERKRAEDALLRYTERLKALNELQEAIVAARSPEEIVQAALARMHGLISFHQARVILCDAADNGYLVFTADVNGEIHFRPEVTFPPDIGLGSAGRELERFSVIEDLRQLTDPSSLEQKLLEDGLRSYVSVPLRSEDEFVGSLYLGSHRPGAFDPERTRIVLELADLLAIATRQARLRHKLQRTNVELEEALKARGEMLQNVSHELRTPLGLIKGYIEVLLEGMMGPLNEEQQAALEVIERQGGRLSYMLDRLLAFKMIDMSSLNLIPLDLRDFLGKIVEAWKMPAAKRRVSLSLQAPADMPALMADPDLLSHLVHNLVDNAIKFSPKGGSVTVCARLEDGQHLIIVADQGIGIPTGKLKRVFERFYQVSQGMHRSFGGMGIGLALCQEIVQAHGGSIWAESDGPGKGSTIYVELPSTQDALASATAVQGNGEN